MGYYTYYNVSMRPADNHGVVDYKAIADVEDKAARILAQKLGIKGLDDKKMIFDDLFYEEMKWYDCDDDMVELSKEFPEYVFTVYGEGEERDDNWKAYYYKGKMWIGQAELVWPDYEADDLINEVENEV